MDKPKQAPKAGPREPPEDVDIDQVFLRISEKVEEPRVILGQGTSFGFEGYVRAGVVTADEDDAGSMCWEGYPLLDPIYNGLAPSAATLWLESLAESLAESPKAPVRLPTT